MKALAVILCLLAVCCATIDTSKKEQGKTSGAGSWETHVPASVAESKVSIIYRGQFATDDDFYYSVKEQIEWILNHNYTIEKLCFEYGNDMTHRKELKCAIITYKEVKNELYEKKEGD